MNGTNSHWPHTNRYLIFAISCRATLARRRAACCMLEAAWCIMQCQTLCWPENKYELNLFAPKLSLTLSTRKCASDTLYVPRSGIKRIILHFCTRHECRQGLYRTHKESHCIHSRLMATVNSRFNCSLVLSYDCQVCIRFFTGYLECANEQNSLMFKAFSIFVANNTIRIIFSCMSTWKCLHMYIRTNTHTQWETAVLVRLLVSIYIQNITYTYQTHPWILL